MFISLREILLHFLWKKIKQAKNKKAPEGAWHFREMYEYVYTFLKVKIDLEKIMDIKNDHHWDRHIFNTFNH